MVQVPVHYAAFRMGPRGPQVALGPGRLLPTLDVADGASLRHAVGQALGTDRVAPPVVVDFPSPCLVFAALAEPPGATWHDVDEVPHTTALQAARARLSSLLPRRPVCSVVGCKETSRRWTPELAERAFMVGRLAALAGFTVLSGGLGGVMSEAARGAQSVGGATVGILPGEDAAAANPHLDLVLPSGIGYARNYLIALASDVMVALPGGRGTLEEMCFALDFERRVISWGSWTVDDAHEIADADALQRELDRFFWARLAARPLTLKP